MLSSNRLTWKPSGGGCAFRSTSDIWGGPYSFGWGGVADGAGDPNDDFFSTGLSTNYTYTTIPQDATKIRVYFTPEGFGPNCITVDICESGGFECPADSICCGGGPGACCQPDGSCVDGVYEVPCTNSGGLYQGEGILCDNVDCPQPVGRCCEDGDPCSECKKCTNTTNEDCAGTWTEGVTCPEGNDDKVIACGGNTFYCFQRACCDTDPCEVKWPCQCDSPQQEATCVSGVCNGACCKPDGTCEDGVGKNACESQGGRFAGPGTVCSGISCDPVSWHCPDNGCPPCVQGFDDLYGGAGYADANSCGNSCGGRWCCGPGGCVQIGPFDACTLCESSCEEDCIACCNAPFTSTEDIYLNNLKDSNQLVTDTSIIPRVPGGKLPVIGETFTYDQAVYLYGAGKVPSSLPKTTDKLLRAFRTKVVSLIPSSKNIDSYVYRSVGTESTLSSDIALINSNFGEATCNICDGGQAPEPLMVGCQNPKTAKLIMEYDVSETCAYDDLEIGVKSFTKSYVAGAPQEKAISIIITVKDQNGNRIKIIEDEISSGFFIENGTVTYDCDTCEAGYECSTSLLDGGYSFYPKLDEVEPGSIFRYKTRVVDYKSLVPENTNEEPRKITAKILGFTEKTEDAQNMRSLYDTELSIIRIQDYSNIITDLTHGPSNSGGFPPRLSTQLKNDADRVESENNGEIYINGNLQDSYGYPGGCDIDSLTEITEGPKLVGIVFAGDESGCPPGQLCSNGLLWDTNFTDGNFTIVNLENLSVDGEQGYGIFPRTIGNSLPNIESYNYGTLIGGTRTLSCAESQGENARRFGGVAIDSRAYNHRVEADFFVNTVGINGTSEMGVVFNIPSSDIDQAYGNNTMIKFMLDGSGNQFQPKIKQYYDGTTSYIGEGQTILTDNSYTGSAITVEANEIIKLIGYVYQNNRFYCAAYRGEQLLFDHDAAITIPSGNGTYVGVSLPRNVDYSVTTYCTNLKVYN